MWKIILWLIFIGIPFVINIVRYTGDIDFVVERSKDPSWLKTMSEYIISFFTGNTPLYVHITTFIIFGLLVFPEYTIYKIRNRHKYKPKKQEQLTKKEIDFKIILPDSKAITAIENVEGKNFCSNPTLEMSVTFLPNQPMQFAELYLRIEKEEIRPSVFDLNLPYIIKDGETHEIMFLIPFKFADKKSRKVCIVALTAGRKWKSKEFYVKFD